MPPTHQLKFRWITGKFAVCRLPADAPLPDWALHGAFTSVTRTADELSVVCPEESVPAEVKSDKGWICFKLEGPFPFSQTGVLSSFIDPLAANGVPIFAIATFDTDYVLIKEEYSGVALSALEQAGHESI
ncbi:MAG TPA: ACT domain-containing protein [Terriglobales bacterium]|nr:ACT domain-containing protein [Terriglobales bacterium]